MNKTIKFLTAALSVLIGINSVGAQTPSGAPKGMGGAMDSWEVNIKPMPADVRNEITYAMSRLNGSEEDRGIISEIGQAVGLGLVSGLVDVVVTETFNLAQYRHKQKEEWMRMIQNENNYTDSISSIKGLKDFYTAPSAKGALDPSDINFNGIEIRGIRNGREVIYMSCSIDRSKLDNMFQHSKFNLVIDTLAFYPYQCHLPNVTSNGIRTMKDIKKGKAHVKGDSIIRPGNGGNGFSFDERNNLKVGIDFSISSSWINQAVQVHKNIELGNFKFSINIPDNVMLYTYSRQELLDRAATLPENERQQFLNRELLNVEGDCFVVPRSFMPTGDGTPMWGTGEYNIKVKVRESCQFVNDSEKGRRWHEDYKRLRQMQNRSGEVQEYFQTLWNQNGMSLVKSSYTTALKTTANHLTGQSAGGSSAAAAAAKKAAQQGGAPAASTPGSPAPGPAPQKP